jgi:hypothetical protein
VYLARHPFAVAASIKVLTLSERRFGRTGGWELHATRHVDQLVLNSGLLEGPLRFLAEEIKRVWSRTGRLFERSVIG